MFWAFLVAEHHRGYRPFASILMEEHGLVTRHFHSDHSPRAAYAFTDKGKEPRRVSAHWPRGVHVMCTLSAAGSHGLRISRTDRIHCPQCDGRVRGSAVQLRGQHQA